MYTSAKVIIAVLILLSVSPSLADSLWVPNSTSLCADSKAKQVGDLVTVIIVESTVSSQQTSTDYNKSLDHSNKQGVGPLMNLIPDLGFSSQQKGSAGGATSMTNKFITKITATVTKVLPNGNLVVTAQRSVLTSGEKQEATLTGTVRPQDVAPDNTVLSTYLADVDLKYTGKGPAGDRQKEGVVSKILKFIF
jgi:flagellar L-ring protein precursor FlgH